MVLSLGLLSLLHYMLLFCMCMCAIKVHANLKQVGGMSVAWQQQETVSTEKAVTVLRGKCSSTNSMVLKNDPRYGSNPNNADN